MDIYDQLRGRIVNTRESCLATDSTAFGRDHATAMRLALVHSKVKNCAFQIKSELLTFMKVGRETLDNWPLATAVGESSAGSHQAVPSAAGINWRRFGRLPIL